ncbi:BPSS1780 family membrane protein [Neisseria leonii]|uniref:BPSS1780 family membrane protein n=1 Tax=Neisseria leonii TaxID=2995413 RepID=A0A9X4E016_9NEIS|nr:BPSS1780 family membrane protein [Neisseria sp. 51.81]MDD9326901.1 BPSS1780 family membrane protein [Neisseria sp. 51.81]
MKDFTFLPPQGNAPKLLPQPRKATMGEGAAWFGQSFRLFKRRPLMWLAMFAVMLLITTVLSMVPVLGIVANFTSLLFAGGLMMSADALSEGDQLEFGYLFAGFKYKFAALLRCTLLYMGVFILLMLVMAAVFALTGGSESSIADLGRALEDPTAVSKQTDSRLYLLILLVVFFGIPATMMVWFAPALITLNDMKAWPAMKLSLRACLQNIPAFVSYLAVLVGLLLLCIVPLGILMSVDSMAMVALFLMVLLIWLYSVLAVLGQYAAYRTVFTDKPLP